jgi:putative aldouronate transport system substrate-binding protein
MKNVGIIGLVIFIILTQFSSCGKHKKDTARIEGNPIVISVVGQGDAPVDLKRAEAIKKIEEKLNVKFEFIFVDRLIKKEVLMSMFAAGDIPDLINIEDLYEEAAFQGVLHEIDLDYLKEKCPNMYRVTTNLVGEVTWEMANINGKLYGIPSPSFEGIIPTIRVIRTDWLKNVGITKIPENLNELEDALYKFAKNDPDGNGLNDTYGMSERGILSVLGAYGYLPFNNLFWTDKNRNLICSAVQPKMKEALMKLAKWYEDGIIDPEFTIGESLGQNWAACVPFWNGKIGYSGGGTMWYHWTSPFDKTNPSDIGGYNYFNFKTIAGKDAFFDFVGDIRGPYGDAYTTVWGVRGAPPSIAIGSPVANDPEKFNKIMELLELQASDQDFYNLCFLGVEGIDYIKTGNPDSPIKNLYESTAEEVGARGIAHLGVGLMRNNIEFAKANEPNSKTIMRGLFADASTMINPICSALPSSYLYGSIMDIIKETYYQIIAGIKPIDDFDKLEKQLNKMGLEILLKEANEYYIKYYD